MYKRARRVCARGFGRVALTRRSIRPIVLQSQIPGRNFRRDSSRGWPRNERPRVPFLAPRESHTENSLFFFATNARFAFTFGYRHTSNRVTHTRAHTHTHTHAFHTLHTPLQAACVTAIPPREILLFHFFTVDVNSRAPRRAFTTERSK